MMLLLEGQTMMALGRWRRRRRRGWRGAMQSGREREGLQRAERGGKDTAKRSAEEWDSRARIGAKAAPFMTVEMDSAESARIRKLTMVKH